MEPARRARVFARKPTFTRRFCYLSLDQQAPAGQGFALSDRAPLLPNTTAPGYALSVTAMHALGSELNNSGGRRLASVYLPNDAADELLRLLGENILNGRGNNHDIHRTRLSRSIELWIGGVTAEPFGLRTTILERDAGRGWQVISR